MTNLFNTKNNTMKEKFFISGGAGFIGSNIVDYLINNNLADSIVIYDNLSSGTLFHINRFLNNPIVSFIEGDLKNTDLLNNSVINVDTVIHLAANPDISKAVTNPDIDFWEGTYLTQNILEAMRFNNIKKIIYTSGSGVYGENESQNFEESFGPMKPISTYGASKLACEAMISSYCHMFDIMGRAFRFANVVGSMQTHGVGYDFLRKLNSNNNELQILGDGTQTKSYVHVSDVISAIFVAYDNMSSDSPDYDVFNVATGDYISVNQIAFHVINTLNLNKENVILKYTGGDRGWKGDVPKIYFNSDKIRKLGWKNKYSSSEAIILSLDSMKKEINKIETP